jgi:hypothetical protein
VIRFVLAVWIGVFAFQSADLFTFVVTDDCTETAGGIDPCPENCSRCVCCARTTVLVSPTVTPGIVSITSPLSLPALDFTDNAHPHGIFHVPKTSLT